MKYRTRYLLECEAIFDAEGIEEAALVVRQHVDSINGTSIRSKRVLGIVPADEPWPNTAESERPPPRNKPPSGSPGTPTVRLDDQLATAVAA